jgi:hypothetical protein
MYKKIKGLRVSALPGNAQFAYMLDVADNAKANATIAEKLSSEIASLDKSLTTEDALMKATKESEELTADIYALVDERRELYMGYKRVVTGFAASPLADVAATAKKLMKHISAYDIDVYSQLDKKTGDFVNFAKDLATSYKEDVNQLALTAFATAMAEKSEEIRQKVNRRDEVSSRMKGTMKAARQQVEAAYKTLKEHINAHIELEGDEAYADFVDTLNAKIDRYKREVLHGAAKKKKADEPQKGKNDKGKTDADPAKQPTTGEQKQDKAEEPQQDPKPSGENTELTPAPADDKPDDGKPSDDGEKGLTPAM